MTLHPAPPFDPLAWMRASTETWWAGIGPEAWRSQLREQRLGGLMAAALRDSPLYRRRSAGACCLAEFEPVGKAELMHDFDDWATDRRITRAGAEAFVADRSAIADAWLGRYLVWTSSGTSGEPGVFVQDGASLAAYDAVDALRLRTGGAAQAPLGLWGWGRRFAFVGATGGHFAGHVSIERLRRIVPPALAPAIHVLSVQEPLRQVAAELQLLKPTVLITYPSCAAALAAMQLQSGLGLRLDEVWLGGEQLSAAQRSLVQLAFQCPVRNSYGASECFSMAFECGHGHLHLNDDWVILEPVDHRLQPVAAGVLSDTTLLTNLANRTQPLLRYRLDDRTRLLEEACPCGCSLPVIEVQGRADDTLLLPDRQGHPVTLLPLALETVIEEEARVTQFQLRQLPDGRLELRLQAEGDDARAAFERCSTALQGFLVRHGVHEPKIDYSAEALDRPGRSGKLRRVLVIPPRRD